MDRPMDLVWRTSATCATQDCVAVAMSGDTVYVRRAEAPAGLTLEFTTEEWRAFLAGVRLGQFDVDLL